MTLLDLNDRRAGALLGLAIGDALGAAVEFQPPGAFVKVTDYRAGGPHRLGPGEWTDDTSMALALADSLCDVGWDLNDQALRYLRWWNHGEYSVNGRCFDIGITTQRALARFEQSGDACSCASFDDHSSGNGSIMRLAPIPIRFVHLFPDDIRQLTDYAAGSSIPTHASEKCLSACRYMSLLLCGLMSGQDRLDVLSPDWPPLVPLREIAPLESAISEIASGSFRQREPPDIVGSGYVVKSLEAAIWAFHNASSFEEAVLRAVIFGTRPDFATGLFQLRVREKKGSQRILQVRDDGKGNSFISLSSQQTGYLLRIFGDPKGTITVQELRGGKTFVASAPSFSALATKHPKFVRESLVPVLKHVGIIPLAQDTKLPASKTAKK